MDGAEFQDASDCILAVRDAMLTHVNSGKYANVRHALSGVCPGLLRSGVGPLCSEEEGMGVAEVAARKHFLSAPDMHKEMMKHGLSGVAYHQAYEEGRYCPQLDCRILHVYVVPRFRFQDLRDHATLAHRLVALLGAVDVAETVALLKGGAQGVYEPSEHHKMHYYFAQVVVVCTKPHNDIYIREFSFRFQNKSQTEAWAFVASLHGHLCTPELHVDLGLTVGGPSRAVAKAGAVAYARQRAKKRRREGELLLCGEVAVPRASSPLPLAVAEGASITDTVFTPPMPLTGLPQDGTPPFPRAPWGVFNGGDMLQLLEGGWTHNTLGQLTVAESVVTFQSENIAPMRLEVRASGVMFAMPLYSCEDIAAKKLVCAWVRAVRKVC